MHEASRHTWPRFSFTVQMQLLYFLAAYGACTRCARPNVGGKCLYAHMEPPAEVLAQFRRRGDQQIMGPELLAICLGLCSFKDELAGRKIVVHSDNTGSEVDQSVSERRLS